MYSALFQILPVSALTPAVLTRPVAAATSFTLVQTTSTSPHTQDVHLLLPIGGLLQQYDADAPGNLFSPRAPVTQKHELVIACGAMFDQQVKKVMDIYLPFSQKNSKTHFLVVLGGHTVYPCQSFLFCEILFPNKLPACKTCSQHCFGEIWAETMTAFYSLEFIF